jgi:heat shock protein HslJ
MKKKITTIAFLATLILIVSCHSTKPVTGTPGGSEMLYASQWNLAELNGTAVTNGKAQLLFYPGQVSRVSGNAGCNKLNGTFELTGTNFIKFSPLATTRMACDPAIRETEFTEALGKVNNWSIVNNQLLLNNGKILLAKLKAVTVESSKLYGDWELNYISGPKIAFEGLYPDKKPQITFNLTANELGGNTSCNGFSSKITIDGNKISIAEPFAKTMIFCEGGGESTFLNMLKKVNKYAVNDGNTLEFMIDDVAVMRFIRKVTGKG